MRWGVLAVLVAGLAHATAISPGGGAGSGGTASSSEISFEPCGRLTLTTGTPVDPSDVSNQGTVYFTPYGCNRIQIYNGSNWVSTEFAELSQASTDSTKSPAATANSTNYDVFVWLDVTTVRATRGPAWSSAVARGTGAGTTELELFQGRYVNKVDITNGPVARRGVYVGSVRSNGTATFDDGVTARHVWNFANRVPRSLRKRVANAANYNYNTATWRQANADAANKVTLLRGLNDEALEIRGSHYVANSAGARQACQAGVSLDVTTAPDTAGAASLFGEEIMASQGTYVGGMWSGLPGLGFHTFNLVQKGGGSANCSWFTDDSGLSGITRQ